VGEDVYNCGGKKNKKGEREMGVFFFNCGDLDYVQSREQSFSDDENIILHKYLCFSLLGCIFSRASRKKDTSHLPFSSSSGEMYRQPKMSSLMTRGFTL